MAMNLDAVFENVCVKAPMAARTKDEAIDELCAMIAERRRLSAHASQFARAVKEHELKGGPQDREGVVFPHAPSAIAGTAVLAIGKFAHPTRWDRKGSSTTRVVCLLIVPEGGRADPVVVELSKMLNNRAIINRFYRCESEKDFQDFFRCVGKNLDVPTGFSLMGSLPPKQRERIQTIGWAPNRAVMAFASVHHNHTVVLWDEPTQAVEELKGHQNTVWDLAWSPDGTRLATGSMDSTIRVWNVQPPAELERSIPLNAYVHGIAWSPDGASVAVARHIGGIQVWDTSTWTLNRALEGANVEPAYRVAWSCDGELLAAVGGRGTAAALQLWEGRSPRAVQRLTRGQGPLVALAWSPTNEFLATGDAAGVIDVWRRERWDCPEKSWGAHHGQITSIAFSHDGQYLVSKGEDGNVLLWSTREWEELACILDPTTGSWWDPVAFHPQQMRLATLGGVGDAIRVWEIRGEVLESGRTHGLRGALEVDEQLPRLPPALVEAVWKREAVLFAGAGMSAEALGVRTANLTDELVADIRRHYPEYDATGRSFETVADEYEAILGADTLTTRLVAEIPQDADPSPSHRIASDLFSTVITTNWDLLFEAAYRLAGSRALVVSSNEGAPAYGADQPTVIKMHGTVETPTTIVATASQYETYHLSHPDLLKLIGTIVDRHVVVFVGYGLRDEHLRRLLATTRYGKQRWAKAAFAVGHFDEARAAVLENRDIKVINCDAAMFFPALQRAVEHLGG